MKHALLAVLFFVPAIANAGCDLLRPELREQVLSSFKTKTDADLSKAFWMNPYKSDAYSVFVVQFKRHDNATNEDRLYTLTASASCDGLGNAMIDSVLTWSIPLSGMPNL